MNQAMQALRAALKRYGPDVATALLSYVSIATNERVSTLEEALQYGSSSQQGFAVVSQGAVQAGININDFFSKGAINSPEMRSLFESLTELGKRVIKQTDDQGQLLATDIDDMANDSMRIAMGNVLRRNFGSLSNARQVQLALETLTERDFIWLESTARAFNQS